MNKYKLGFTLVEVMVAMAIIAIALASLIKASGNHTNSAGYLKNKTLAHYAAMNEIADLQIKLQWPKTGSKDGSTELADHEWYWTRLVEKTGDASGNIRSVKFTIFSDEERTRSIARVQAFIANPKPSTTTIASGAAGP